jgi:hypothetical protein
VQIGSVVIKKDDLAVWVYLHQAAPKAIAPFTPIPACEWVTFMTVSQTCPYLLANNIDSRRDRSSEHLLSGAVDDTSSARNEYRYDSIEIASLRIRLAHCTDQDLSVTPATVE